MKEATCADCRFFNITRCQRYPQYVPRTKEDWCGEFVPAEGIGGIKDGVLATTDGAWSRETAKVQSVAAGYCVNCLGVSLTTNCPKCGQQVVPYGQPFTDEQWERLKKAPGVMSTPIPVPAEPQPPAPPPAPPGKGRKWKGVALTSPATSPPSKDPPAASPPPGAAGPAPE